MPKLFTDQKLVETVKIWTHSDAWIGTVARSALRVKLGHYDFTQEQELEARREVLDAIKRKVI